MARAVEAFASRRLTARCTHGLGAVRPSEAGVTSARGIRLAHSIAVALVGARKLRAIVAPVALFAVAHACLALTVLTTPGGTSQLRAVLA